MSTQTLNINPLYYLHQKVYLMKKLLYITDQDEYVDHSFIAPLFEIYLRQHMHVDIVYFSDFKSDFERKDKHHFTVPSRYKDMLLEELQHNDVKMSSYDFVMVRNNIHIMQHILDHRKTYGYKALYRFSYPKRSIKMCHNDSNNTQGFLPHVKHYFKTIKETKIINSCDAFFPTSKSMHKAFLPKVNIPTVICSPAINAKMLHDNIQHKGDEKRFVYVGTIDKTREFEMVLDAFSKVSSKQWQLLISTRDTQYAHAMLTNYPNIRKQVEIYSAKTKTCLLDLVAKADIGIALLPDIPIYNTAIPVKIFDYYSSAIPCLMTDTEHTSTVFTDCNDAWFANFTQEAITTKINYLLTLSKEDVMNVGKKGQERLLATRNYVTLAQTITDKLEAL